MKERGDFVGCGCNHRYNNVYRNNDIRTRIADVQDRLQNLQQRNNCDSCVCQQLRRLPSGTEVILFLNGNKIENVTFVSIDSCTCCVHFVDTETGTVFVLNCLNIQALGVV